MAITPKETADAAIARARHLLTLYDLLHDSRQRGTRADWYGKFCKVMHWPAKESVVRVDGKDKKSVLILREELGLSREQFAHDYVSELLRASYTTAMAAVDRYMHDQIVKNCVRLLRSPEKDVPKALRQFKLPVLTVKRSLEKQRSDSKSRPGTILKSDLQELLHRDETFQSVSEVERGAQILGLKDFWGRIAKQMSTHTTPGAVQNRLRKIGERRNQIVHEADIVLQQRAREIKLRDVSKKDASDAVDFIEELIRAIDKLIQEDC